jgi:hypothetical protein
LRKGWRAAECQREKAKKSGGHALHWDSFQSKRNAETRFQLL